MDPQALDQPGDCSEEAKDDAPDERPLRRTESFGQLCHSTSVGGLPTRRQLSRSGW